MHLVRSSPASSKCSTAFTPDGVGSAGASAGLPRVKADLEPSFSQPPTGSALGVTLRPAPARRSRRRSGRSGTKLESPLESVIMMPRVLHLTRNQDRAPAGGLHRRCGYRLAAAWFNPFWALELRAAQPPERPRKEGGTKLECCLESGACSDSPNATSGWPHAAGEFTLESLDAATHEPPVALVSDVRNYERSRNVTDDKGLKNLSPKREKNENRRDASAGAGERHPIAQARRGRQRSQPAAYGFVIYSRGLGESDGCAQVTSNEGPL